MVWNLSSVEMEKGEEEVKSRRKKKSLGIKFRKSREKWCEEESDSEESEEDQGSGKYCKEKTRILEKERLQWEKGQKTEFSEDDKEYEGSDQEIECGDEESDQESSRRKKRSEKKDTRKKTVKMMRKIK